MPEILGETGVICRGAREEVWEDKEKLLGERRFQREWEESEYNIGTNEAEGRQTIKWTR